MTEQVIGPMGFPLELIWRDETGGLPVLIWAEFDPDIAMFWLYWSQSGAAELEWLGDADDCDDPEQWCPEIAAEVRCFAQCHPDPTQAPPPSMAAGLKH